jgi:hypothetical protein
MERTGTSGRMGKTFPSFPSFPSLFFLLMLACSGPRQNVGPAPAEADGFSLILRSNHLLDVNIFVLHDGQADRVATIPSSSSRAVVLPRWMLGQSNTIRLIAEPIGDDSRYMTDILLVQPGQIIEFNVEGSLDRSSYSIQ